MIGRNVLGNLLGQSWVTLMGIVFVPAYIKALGMQGYGLISTFAVLQSLLSVMDIGLTPALAREMARYRAGEHSPQSICNLTMTVERLSIAVALLITTLMVLSAPWLANNWIHSDRLLPSTTIVEVFSFAGVLIGCRYLLSLYRSALNGLQQQIWVNVCSATFATIRGAGTLAVLLWLSASVQAFSLSQCAITGVEMLVTGGYLRRSLPASPHPAQFNKQALAQVWQFAAGMFSVAILSVMLMQVDKMLLSHLLTLQEFGYYALAGTVVGLLSAIVGPVYTATLPMLTELVARDDETALTRAYHQCAQIMSVLLVTPAMLLACFPDHLLLLWTNDSMVVQKVAPLLSVMAVGTMLNGFMHIPYALQLAHGWTQLTIRMNLISVVLLVPALYFGIGTFGTIAAASVWLILNCSYVLFGVPFMHQRLLRTAQFQWYCKDIGVPLLVGFVAAAVMQLLAPGPDEGELLRSIGILACAGFMIFTATAVSSEVCRKWMQRCLASRLTGTRFADFRCDRKPTLRAQDEIPVDRPDRR